MRIKGPRRVSDGELEKTAISSDIHLNHSNILPYCGRPWLKSGDFIWNEEDGCHSRGKWVSKAVKAARTDAMNEALVSNWNSVVQPDWTTYHVGDFCMSRSGLKPAEWESRLNGKIIHITGNHDRSNGVKGLKYAVLEVTGHSFFLVHRPPYRVEELPDFCDVVLCGHIHEAWNHKWVRNRLLLNVGVDVRGYKPWPLGDVVAEAERLLNARPSRSSSR